MSSTGVAQTTVRPRAALGIGSGSQHIDCALCGANDVGVLSIALEAGASINGRALISLEGIAWTEPELIDGADHSTFFLGVSGGYQLHPNFAVRAGVGRHVESWNSTGVSSSGAAASLALEGVLGRRTGIGLRLQLQAVQAISGTRRAEFEGEVTQADFKPRLLQASLGVIWR
jgi:hypothetical protein